MLEGLARFKVPIRKTLDAALAWTNAILPPEQKLDDSMIVTVDEIVERLIPDPAPPQP